MRQGGLRDEPEAHTGDRVRSRSSGVTTRFDPGAAGPPAHLRSISPALQRMVGNAATTVVIQRATGNSAVDAAVRRVRAKGEGVLDDATLGVVLRYAHGAKNSDSGKWETYMESMVVSHTEWLRKRSHVMFGAMNDERPTGLHSIAAGPRVVEPLGNPTPGSTFYRQWVGKPNAYYDASPKKKKWAKPSSFFPANWSEDQIKALVILDKAADYRPQAARGMALAVNDESVFPNLQAPMPPLPAGRVKTKDV
ncbi:hypothetical protein [Occultella gossypii]|uniref:Uncharacterized protein n=1 Tax=Occultella gossypii TaxID=2800820 RepID=A0ABS7S8S6_9MICO|nr:hypothetical protein [Occultella gossypii]MBZ2196756.1 hypothetical protein [Occultella gossypii]